MKDYPHIEFQSLEEQASLQWEKQKSLLRYLEDYSPYYRSLFLKNGIHSETIQTISDWQQLPFTTKDQVQQYNDSFLAVPDDQIAEYTATSGTLGKPLTGALSAGDIDRLGYNESLSFQLMELNRNDRIQFMLTLDRQFMAGMAYYLGAQKLGCAAIRTGPGLPAMQIEIMQRLRSTVLIAVPSFLLKLIEYAHSEHIDLNQLAVRKVLCIGENIRNEDFSLNTLGSLIQESWNIQLFSTYASTEMQTAFTECSAGCGGHLHPELLFAEVIDEEGNPCAAGTYGELCISTLGVEAMPLLRYRTGDICCFHETPCACGLHSPRLSPVAGRKQQMIKYKGTTLYPPAIFNLLNQCRYISEYIVEVYENEIHTDALRLHISTPLSVDDCERQLRNFLQSRLRVIPELQFHGIQEMNQMLFPEGSRKAVRFKDHRPSSIQ